MVERRREGISTVEVLVAVAVCAVLGLPILVLLGTSTHEAAVSEDYMFAEALALRHLAEAMSRPLGEIEAVLPLTIPIEGVPADDGALAQTMEEYRRNLAGPQAFKGAVQVRLLEPGLVLYEASVSWPVRPGAPLRREYALMRVRSRQDIALSSSFDFKRPSVPPCWRLDAKDPKRGERIRG